MGNSLTPIGMCSSHAQTKSTRTLDARFLISWAMRTAQTTATRAIQSSRRTCLMTRNMTVNPTSGGSFATHRLHGSRASTSMAHGRWRNANLLGHRGSASTSECRSLSSCCSHAGKKQTALACAATSLLRPSSALAISTSSTRR